MIDALTFKCFPDDVKGGLWTIRLPVLRGWPQNYKVYVLYGEKVAVNDVAYLSDSIIVEVGLGSDLSKYKVIIESPDSIKVSADQFLADLRAGKLPPSRILREFEVICDDTNNSKEDIAAGRLTVDMVFYGSLAQDVRARIAESEAEANAAIQQTPPTRYNALLLDFDGTLFPRRFFLSGKGADPVLVHICNVLCREYDFRIVISAGMKEQGIDKCKETLEQVGIDPAYLMPDAWSTNCTDTYYSDRFKQVEQWYEKFKDTVGTVLVFDDAFCPHTSPVYEFWMQCYEETGLRMCEIVSLYSDYPKLLQNKETE